LLRDLPVNVSRRFAVLSGGGRGCTPVGPPACYPLPEKRFAAGRRRAAARLLRAAARRQVWTGFGLRYAQPALLAPLFLSLSLFLSFSLLYLRMCKAPKAGLANAAPGRFPSDVLPSPCSSAYVLSLCGLGGDFSSRSLALARSLVVRVFALAAAPSPAPCPSRSSSRRLTTRSSSSPTTSPMMS